MDPFQDYRPYSDAEIPDAMLRIVSDPVFPKVADYVYPGVPLEDVKRKVASITTVYDLQVVIMRDALERVMRNSMTEFTYEVSSLLNPDEPYLFVSNHRDITLDAMLLDYALHFSGHAMPQITFGSNLMEFPLMSVAGRANKMFRVDRGGSPREFYRKLMLTSQYIRHVITEQHESVWIAQRNGRTKDGLDATDPAIVKMFALSGDKDLTQALLPLHIVPVTISYEWEPCDLLKAEERFRSCGGHYVKAPGEDVHSIMTGILSPKGRVHLHIGDPLTPDEIASCDGDPRRVASLLDSHINPAFTFYPNNYVAAELLGHAEKLADHPVTDAEREAFEARLQQLSDPLNPDLRSLFLHIYANPLIR